MLASMPSQVILAYTAGYHTYQAKARMQQTRQSQDPFEFSSAIKERLKLHQFQDQKDQESDQTQGENRLQHQHTIRL